MPCVRGGDTVHSARQTDLENLDSFTTKSALWFWNNLIEGFPLTYRSLPASPWLSSKGASKIVEISGECHLHLRLLPVQNCNKIDQSHTQRIRKNTSPGARRMRISPESGGGGNSRCVPAPHLFCSFPPLATPRRGIALAKHSFLWPSVLLVALSPPSIVSETINSCSVIVSKVKQMDVQHLHNVAEKDSSCFVLLRSHQPPPAADVALVTMLYYSSSVCSPN